MEKKSNIRLMFGFDVMLLSLNLDAVKEPDKRNERASNLIKKACMIYLSGGKQYEDMLQNVGDNALGEYQEWYTEHIFNVVMNNPEYIINDGKKEPMPKYDVNKYDLGKYFDGLNKEVFEELQKLILYLRNPASDEAFKIAGDISKNDPSFPDHTKYFFILAHSILIATLEGGEFLDRIEKIFQGYDISEEDKEFINSQIEKNILDSSESLIDKNELIKRISIQKIAKDFLANPRNN
jgi:hypothetical protein